MIDPTRFRPPTTGLTDPTKADRRRNDLDHEHSGFRRLAVGERHDWAVREVGVLLTLGRSEEQIFETLAPALANADQTDHAYGADDLWADIDSCLRLYGGAPLTLLSAADVEPEEVRWLIEGYIPRSKGSVVAGLQGVGKGVVLANLAAQVSKGGKLVDGTLIPKGRVIWLTGEDGLADTVVPRLIAAGADLSSIDVQSVSNLMAEGGFTLDSDGVRRLTLAIQQRGADWIILDPANSFIPVKDWRDDLKVRAAYAPIIAMAEATGAAVTSIAHLSKDQAQTLLGRVMGSTAYTAIPRTVMAVVENPDEGDGDASRMLAVIKTNLARKPKALTYRIDDDGDGRPVAMWTGVTDATPDDWMKSERVSGNKLSAAIDAIREILAAGATPWSSYQGVAQQLEELGINSRTGERARDRMKADKEIDRRRIKDGRQGSNFEWYLTTTTEVTPPIPGMVV